MIHDGTIATELVGLARVLTSGKKDKKQNWMAEFDKKIQKLQKRQDYWDTATYLYNQGMAPDEAAKKVMKTAAGADLDIFKALVPAYKKMGNVVSNSISRIKYIDGQIRDNEKIRSNRYSRAMGWNAYTRGDMEAKVDLYLELSGNDSWVILTIETPFGPHDHINKEFKGVIPVGNIVKTIESALS